MSIGRSYPQSQVFPPVPVPNVEPVGDQSGGGQGADQWPHQVDQYRVEVARIPDVCARPFRVSHRTPPWFQSGTRSRPTLPRRGRSRPGRAVLPRRPRCALLSDHFLPCLDQEPARKIDVERFVGRGVVPTAGFASRVSPARTRTVADRADSDEAALRNPMLLQPAGQPQEVGGVRLAPALDRHLVGRYQPAAPTWNCATAAAPASRTASAPPPKTPALPTCPYTTWTRTGSGAPSSPWPARSPPGCNCSSSPSTPPAGGNPSGCSPSRPPPA